MAVMIPSQFIVANLAQVKVGFERSELHLDLVPILIGFPLGWYPTNVDVP